MEIVRQRYTCRAFAPAEVPRDHYELILEAARHAPSGANSQSWHYVVVTDPALKARLGDRFVQEQIRRAKLGMKFPTPNYKGIKTAPGLIAIAADFRFVRAFPVLNDGSEVDLMYKANAERILIQSVAASTMLAHLAATALGYGVWWVTAIGQEEIQRERSSRCWVSRINWRSWTSCASARPRRPPYKRWNKRLDQIVSWNRFNMDNFVTDEQVEEWIRTDRVRVMYRDESRVD